MIPLLLLALASVSSRVTLSLPESIAITANAGTISILSTSARPWYLSRELPARPSPILLAGGRHALPVPSVTTFTGPFRATGWATIHAKLPAWVSLAARGGSVNPVLYTVCSP